MSVPTSHELSPLLRNLRAERDSAELYDVLAGLACNPQQRSIYRNLASAKRRHAAFWEDRLTSAGQPLPGFRLSLRTSLIILLARCLGIRFIVPSVIAREIRDREEYSGQADARAAGLAEEERTHAVTLRDSGRHDALGNNLRAAVLGANDGLASNFCLMMGVAGAGATTSVILMIGAAGLVAGACSMALGEWVSVTNAHELMLSQQDRTAGIPDHPWVHGLLSTSDALSAAGYSCLLFGLGALVPLLPFIALPVALRVSGAIAGSMAALFLLGLTTSLFNARSPLYSGVRQVVIGTAAAGITYLAGRVFALLAGGTL